MVCRILRCSGRNLPAMEMRRPMNFVGGEVIGIDKPLKWTSFDAVKRLRGALQRRLGIKRFKVGHAGTLDPLATGVLVVCTGKATKRIESLQSGSKEYVATVRLGSTTPSYDLETEIDRHYPTGHITREAVKAILPQFTGRIMQVPPVYSAVKIDGERAYKFARTGEDIELKAKPLEITELELTDWQEEPMTATLRVVCSKGTYIRALARDLGEALESGAHLIGLRRTRVGEIEIGQCLSIDEAIEMIRECEIEAEEEQTSSRDAAQRNTASGREYTK